MPRRRRRDPRRVTLTELSVRKAQPEAAAYLMWDRRQRGLALRVQPTGRKAWNMISSRLGRPRWLYLGDANAIGLADARIMAAEAALAVAKGGDPAAEKRAQRGTGTFADLHARYLEEHAKKHNKGWRQADALIRRHVLPRWGKLQASTISRAREGARRAHRSARRRQPNTDRAKRDLLVGAQAGGSHRQSLQIGPP
jgi:hypothetical protein